jgi:hypothetical protein
VCTRLPACLYLLTSFLAPSPDITQPRFARLLWAYTPPPHVLVPWSAPLPLSTLCVGSGRAHRLPSSAPWSCWPQPLHYSCQRTGGVSSSLNVWRSCPSSLRDSQVWHCRCAYHYVQVRGGAAAVVCHLGVAVRSLNPQNQVVYELAALGDGSCFGSSSSFPSRGGNAA